MVSNLPYSYLHFKPLSAKIHKKMTSWELFLSTKFCFFVFGLYWASEVMELGSKNSECLHKVDKVVIVKKSEVWYAFDGEVRKYQKWWILEDVSRLPQMMYNQTKFLIETNFTLYIQNIWVWLRFPPQMNRSQPKREN